MVVRMRHTRSHTKNRRSHHKIAKPAITRDENGVPHLRHRASVVTGKYRGKQVENIEAKMKKKEERMKRKAEILGKK